MRTDDADQPSLNFFQLAQRLGATVSPARVPRSDGIGLRSPMLAWQQMQATAPPAVLEVPELPTAQLEVFFEQVCGSRGYRPEALLWDKELAGEYFSLVESRLRDLPRRAITRHLLKARVLKASGKRAWADHLRQRSPGCEPAVEWALCRIRFTCGDVLRDILDVICDPQLGEAYALLARAMAPDWLRDMPLPQARSLLFRKAYVLQRNRETGGHRASWADKQEGVQNLIAKRLASLSHSKEIKVPPCQGLVQLNDGEQCLFLCHASDVNATIAEIASATALKLLARHYWAFDPATLRIGYALAKEVVGIDRSRSEAARDSRSSLRAVEGLLIAKLQPTFNWPMRFVDSKSSRK